MVNFPLAFVDMRLGKRTGEFLSKIKTAPPPVPSGRNLGGMCRQTNSGSGANVAGRGFHRLWPPPEAAPRSGQIGSRRSGAAGGWFQRRSLPVLRPKPG